MSLSKESLVREMLGRVADKWSLIVMDELEDGPHRFSQLQKRIPEVSQKMLTQTLRALEADGLIIRTVYPEVPSRVEYKLTKMGSALNYATCDMWKWAEKYYKHIEKLRNEKKY